METEKGRGEMEKKIIGSFLGNPEARADEDGVIGNERIVTINGWNFSSKTHPELIKEVERRRQIDKERAAAVFFSDSNARGTRLLSGYLINDFVFPDEHPAAIEAKRRETASLKTEA